MSRILKRPMFRKGGEVMEGIMTGIKPRQNYALGDKVENYRNVLRAATQGASTGPDALTQFLLRTGKNLIGGESAGGTKLQEVVGSTNEPMENYFKDLQRKAQQEKQIGLQAGMLGIKGQQAIDAARAKGNNNLQKEFSPKNLRDRLLMDYSKRKPGYQKELKDIYSYEMATFNAIDRNEISQVPAFKGKNLSIMEHDISGSKAKFITDDLIAGTLYFRPDQPQVIYERDPDKNAIVIYNKKTGNIVKEISLGD